MDGNKDEALKCLRIGKEALRAGDRTRCIKFLSKARRLDPTLPVDDLLSAAAEGASADGQSPPSDESNPQNEPDTAAAAGSNSTTSSSASSTARLRRPSAGPSKDYTEEQVTIVRQIKKQRDYYQILGVDRGCTVEDVRKAYRKLSLKVHPDKNKAPGAEEAFKAVSKAFQCLSDEESRKRYDIVGSEEPSDARPAARHHGPGFNGFYDADINADEIFRNFFFGGGMPQAAATPFGTFAFRTGGMGRPSAHEMHGSGGFNPRALLQILPVIILILMSIIPSSDPVYMISPSHQYDYKVETSRGVPYYVKSAKFEQEYPYQSPKRIDLEHDVERDYFAILKQNCHVELQRQQWGLAYKTPHCDMLRKYQEAA